MCVSVHFMEANELWWHFYGRSLNSSAFHCKPPVDVFVFKSYIIKLRKLLGRF